jgi:proteasome lid subunit RPN8/RPN11
MTEAKTLILPEGSKEQIRKHAQERYPFEACGGLLGHWSHHGAAPHVIEVEPIPNGHEEDQRHRYRIPPEFQLRMELRARAAGQEILGYYHSHPDRPVDPSDHDLAHAWQGYVYMICSVLGGEAADVGGFVLDTTGSAFVPLEIRRADPFRRYR